MITKNLKDILQNENMEQRFSPFSYREKNNPPILMQERGTINQHYAKKGTQEI